MTHAIFMKIYIHIYPLPYIAWCLRTVTYSYNFWRTLLASNRDTNFSEPLQLITPRFLAIQGKHEVAATPKKNKSRKEGRKLVCDSYVVLPRSTASRDTGQQRQAIRLRASGEQLGPHHRRLGPSYYGPPTSRV